MAQRARPIASAALAAAAVIAALTLGTAAVVLAAGRGVAPAPADWAAVRFSLVQAALSAAVSVALAVPVARALARRRFPGRGLLITLMGAPFLIPVIVTVFGLLAVFGRAGLLNRMVEGMGLAPVSIYGLHGVVLAHVFLNLPLATRMILQGWQAIPAERLRLAAGLDLPPGAVFRHLEWPMLRDVVPGAAIVIFVLCLTSFAVALTLGGGPAATTVELAIYQALRFDYDLGRAAALAAVQFGLCALAVGTGALFARPSTFGAGLDRPRVTAPPDGWRAVADGAAILVAAIFLMVPMAMIVARGIPGLSALPGSVWPALARSLGVSLAATGLCVAVAMTLALAVAKGARGARLVEMAATLPLAASGLVLGTGLFLVVQPFVAPERLALPVTILVNALLALPFVFRLVLPEARTLVADYGRLAAALDLGGVAALRWLVLPRLARPLGFAAGVAAALAMGDLGVIALFAGEAQATLPLVVQRLMGAYRMEAAAGASVVLVAASLALFALFDWGGRRAAA